MRPRSVGSFLISRSASAGDLRRRCRGPGRVGAIEVGRLQQVALHAGAPSSATSSTPSISVSNTLTCCAARRRDVLADVVGPDRQLPMAPVDEHGQLDARRDGPGRAARQGRRESTGRRRGRRRPGRPAGRLSRLGQAPWAPPLARPQPQVVTVEGDVGVPTSTVVPEKASIRAASRRASGAPRVGMPTRTREERPPSVDRDRRGGLFDELVGHPVDHAGDVGGGEQCADAEFRAGSAELAMRPPSPPHWTGR